MDPNAKPDASQTASNPQIEMQPKAPAAEVNDAPVPAGSKPTLTSVVEDLKQIKQRLEEMKVSLAKSLKKSGKIGQYKLTSYDTINPNAVGQTRPAFVVRISIDSKLVNVVVLRDRTDIAPHAQDNGVLLYKQGVPVQSEETEENGSFIPDAYQDPIF